MVPQLPTVQPRVHLNANDYTMGMVPLGFKHIYPHTSPTSAMYFHRVSVVVSLFTWLPPVRGCKTYELFMLRLHCIDHVCMREEQFSFLYGAIN